MNVIHFTGNVGGDAEVRSAGNDRVCNFNVAVKQGYGRDAPTAWYRVEVWGKRGESLAQHVKKGGKVAVCGEFIIDEYQGKPQYRVRAHDVDPFMGARQDNGGNGSQQRPTGGGYSGQGSSQGGGGWSNDDLDDDSVPF